MSRHTRRVSRPLIAVLGLTMAAGIGIYVHNVKKVKAADPRVAAAASSANPKPADPSMAAVVPVSLPQRAPSSAVVTQTPTGPAAASASGVSQASLTSAGAKPTQGNPPPPTTRPVTLIENATAATPAPTLGAATASAQPLKDARAKMDAGDLLAARLLLNEPLVSGRFTGADSDAARQMLSEISQTVVFSKKRFKDDPFQTAYQVQNGERLSRIADKHIVTWEALCKINGLADPKKIRAGQWLKIPVGPFHAVVTKSAYRLDLYLGSPGESGSLFVTSFPVGLGKDNSTPTGLWMIMQGSKAHPATYYSPRGEGVMAPDDPKNPLGGYWMGLTGLQGNAVDKNSYGIHGTIEPETVGKQSSMGCIRLRHDDIATLYDLLIDGKSKVVVKD